MTFHLIVWRIVFLHILVLRLRVSVKTNVLQPTTVIVTQTNANHVLPVVSTAWKQLVVVV